MDFTAFWNFEKEKKRKKKNTILGNKVLTNREELQQTNPLEARIIASYS